MAALSTNKGKQMEDVLHPAAGIHILCEKTQRAAENARLCQRCSSATEC